MGGAVIVGPLELPEHAPVRALGEAVTRERRTQDVLCEPFERRAGAGRYVGVGMDVVAVGLGEQRGGAGRDADRRQAVASSADVGDPPAGLGAEGDALGGRGGAQGREPVRLFGGGIAWAEACRERSRTAAACEERRDFGRRAGRDARDDSALGRGGSRSEPLAVREVGRLADVVVLAQAL